MAIKGEAMGKVLAATWKPIIDDKVHTVELRLDQWTSRGEVLVDGKIADAWGTTWRGGGTRKFEVAGKPAIIKNGLLGWGDLIIDGQKVKPPLNWFQKQNKVLQIIVTLAAFAVFPLAIWLFSSSLEWRVLAIFLGIIMFALFIIAVFKIIKQPRGKE